MDFDGVAVYDYYFNIGKSNSFQSLYFLEFIFLLFPCGSCEMQPLGYFSPDKPALIVVFGGWLTDYILRVSRHAI